MSSKDNFQTQVRLRRRPVPGGKSPWCSDGSRWRETCLKTGESFWLTMTWVPSKFAIKGKFLEIKNHESGEMENGWEVVEVGSKVDFAKVEAAERDHMKQRKASDI